MDKEQFWTMALAMCGAQLAARAARLADALTRAEDHVKG